MANGVIAVVEGIRRARSKQGALVWRDGFAPGEAVLDQAVGGDEHIEMAGVALDALGEADGVEEGIEGVRNMFQPAVESVFAAAIEVGLSCFEQAGGKTSPLASSFTPHLTPCISQRYGAPPAAATERTRCLAP